ncbi:hypothetical protein VOLCADRAFT_91310 [Volvox carteri f. nagariensis]|uniref:Uncharacterized protein n=1 Tax=Volvox carteri f. nagariensis TaxID=3068 RepID=D8TWQ6_VOLCA|nr:uncharacterized protein VOLCADRAFT_91310 [Volvox carteri f. nagariensis]EFJ48190.1 hypothetical protein VOLCADRAFT_91310 [Volvox carteri f. nagariensis]|eukprot:XP_002950875.1 hypothetical protein VOLCADRAFT_91310 [Volvox carteri f. nagariensis]
MSRITTKGSSAIIAETLLGRCAGETVTTTTQHLRDYDDMATVTESRAAVTAAMCCATMCSFYDEVGELSGGSPAPASAAAVAASSGTSGFLRPSMRESAVTLALLRRQLRRRHDSQQAVLLLLVTTSSDHNGATLTWQFRCYQARLVKATGEMLMEPVELHVLNLGGHIGHTAYQELSAAASIMASTSQGTRPQQLPVQHVSMSSPTSSATAAAAAAATALPGADAAALAVLAAGARGQVAAMKQHCDALLSGLHELCGQAVAGEATVAALRRRRDALLAQLARTQ